MRDKHGDGRWEMQDGKDGAPPETKCREGARGRKRRKEGKSAGNLPEFSAFTMNVGHE